MQHPRIQRNLLTGALWLVSVAISARALPVASGGDDTSQVGTPTVEFVMSVEPEIPTAWNGEERTGAGEFTETVLGDHSSRSGDAQESVSLREVAVSPTGEARSEERVPEPATLVLVGTALIAVAGASRRKRPWHKFGRFGAPRIRIRAAQEV